MEKSLNDFRFMLPELDYCDSIPIHQSFLSGELIA
jgi:hypothetical protein